MANNYNENIFPPVKEQIMCEQCRKGGLSEDAYGKCAICDDYMPLPKDNIAICIFCRQDPVVKDELLKARQINE